MPTDATQSPSSFSKAIEECTTSIADHRLLARQAYRALLTIGLLGIFAVAGIIFSPFSFVRFFTESSSSQGGSDTHVIYVLFGVLSVLIAIAISLYRYHLAQIEHYQAVKLGFYRILFLTEGSRSKLQPEVIRVLTESAFPIGGTSRLKNPRHIENPVPGHPTLEVGSALLNKLIDALDIVIVPKEHRAKHNEEEA